MINTILNTINGFDEPNGVSIDLDRNIIIIKSEYTILKERFYVALDLSVMKMVNLIILTVYV